MEQLSSHAYDFVGKYDQLLGEKRRIVLPAEWRETIAARNPPEACTLLYATYGYASAFDFVELYDIKGYESHRYEIMSDECYRLKLDKQHRFVLPNELATHAGLDTKLVLVASPDKDTVRIWSAPRYAKWRELQRCQNEPKS